MPSRAIAELTRMPKNILRPRTRMAPLTAYTNVERKHRLTQFRKAGHAWGQREADLALMATGGIRPEKFIRMSIRERVVALRSIGADDQEIEAWSNCCQKQF